MKAFYINLIYAKGSGAVVGCPARHSSQKQMDSPLIESRACPLSMESDPVRSDIWRSKDG
jgi:hypothetical protein